MARRASRYQPTFNAPALGAASAAPSLTGSDTGAGYGQSGTLLITRGPDYRARAFGYAETVSAAAVSEDGYSLAASLVAKRKTAPITRVFAPVPHETNGTDLTDSLNGAKLVSSVGKRKPLPPGAVFAPVPLEVNGDDSTGAAIGRLTISIGKRKPQPLGGVFAPVPLEANGDDAGGAAVGQYVVSIGKRKPAPRSAVYAPTPVESNGDDSAGTAGFGLVISVGYRRKPRRVDIFAPTDDSAAAAVVQEGASFVVSVGSRRKLSRADVFMPTDGAPALGGETFVVSVGKRKPQPQSSVFIPTDGAPAVGGEALVISVPSTRRKRPSSTSFEPPYHSLDGYDVVTSRALRRKPTPGGVFAPVEQTAATPLVGEGFALVTSRGWRRAVMPTRVFAPTHFAPITIEVVRINIVPNAVASSGISEPTPSAALAPNTVPGGASGFSVEQEANIVVNSQATGRVQK